MSRASGATRWSRRDWALFAEAWLALLVARLALRRWPMPELLLRLERWSHRRATPAATEALVRAVWRAARLHALPMLCLPRSLALAWMMARRGQPCELVIGASPRDGTLDAHAWIEQGGIPLNSPEDSEAQFPVLMRRPVPGA